MPRLVCLVRILEMPNRRSRAKDSPMRRLRNGGDVDGGNEEKRGTTAGHGGRAAPRGQAQGQAQGQAVAAGTSSRLSLLMPRPRAAGRDGEAHLLLRLCNLYILCDSVRCFSVVRGREFEIVSQEFRSYSVRAWSAASALRRESAIATALGCAPPSTRCAIRAASVSVVTASLRSSSVAPGLS